MIGIDMLTPAHLERGWRDLYNLYKAEMAMLSKYRRERAIERIKAQPFFNPRLPVPGLEMFWLPLQEDGARKFNQPCSACGGVGYIIPAGPVWFRHSRLCDVCDGTGGTPR